MALARVSPFRAVLYAHFQAVWNRTAREMGKTGRFGLVIVLTLLVLLGGLPVVALSGMGGFALGSHFDHRSAPLILGGVLGIGAVLVGAISGILGGSKALQWESYRAFPLPLRPIFAAELAAGIADPVPALGGLAALSMCLGLSVARPSLFPFALLLWAQTMLWMLLLEHLAGSLAAVLMKRLKVALVVFGLIFWMLMLFSSMLPGWMNTQAGQPVGTVMGPERVAQIRAAAAALLAFLGVLPSTHAARSLSDALAGRWFQAVFHQLAPIGLLLLMLFFVARRMESEAEPEAMELARTPKGAERLWGFRTPSAGIAKLHWRIIMGSQLGRFGLLMPVMTAVLLKGPMMRLHGQRLWALPGAFAYLALAGSQMQFNQFGLDGHGVKSLLLLPIRPRDILLGKLGGLALYQGLQAGFLMVLLTLLMRPAPLGILAALCLAGCFFFVQMSVGQWTSLWMPRAMPRNSLKSGSMPLPVVLISMGSGIANSLFFGGTFVLCAWKAPGVLLPLMASMLAGCALVYWHLLPTFEVYLEDRRENLVEAMK